MKQAAKRKAAGPENAGRKAQVESVNLPDRAGGCRTEQISCRVKRMLKTYVFDAVLQEEPDGGAYIVFPYDIRQEFGRGRVKAHVEFNDVPYDGSIVNMGVKDEDGKICYVIGVLKSVRHKLGVVGGDRIHVRIRVETEENRGSLPRGEKPRTVDEYISWQDARLQPRLQEIRRILRDALPGAEERISWSMPTFWKGRNIIHFAACENHLGLYPGGEAVEVFAAELSGFDTSKGAIRIPWSVNLPADLIGRIARWCLAAYQK